MHSRAYASALAFTAALITGAYLCTHDCPAIGAVLLVLTLLATWGFEPPAK
jgi:hypothetical protein